MKQFPKDSKAPSLCTSKVSGDRLYTIHVLQGCISSYYVPNHILFGEYQILVELNHDHDIFEGKENDSAERKT